jgi:hypothetical protein
MGHFLFLLLHAGALLVYPPALWVTLPLHLIYGVLGRRRADALHRCPDCKELVLKAAVVCKHCGCRLKPSA